jgi:hypothetical protein
LHLIADAGSFAVSGQSIEFIETAVLTLDTGSFTFTGENVSLLPNLTLPGETGQFVLSGQILGIAQFFPITGVGSIGLTGQDTDLRVVRTRRFEGIDNITSIEIAAIGANSASLTTTNNEAA